MVANDSEVQCHVTNEQNLVTQHSERELILDVAITWSKDIAL